MPKKYYAVRRGAAIGIFEDWETCKTSVNGFPGAEYKSFPTKAQAEQYLSGVAETDSFSDAAEVYAYVDGSFNAALGVYGYGCVICTPDGRTELSGQGSDPDAVSARNVAGELLGTMQAVRWAIQNGYPTITVFHDYTGIARWFYGDWKAESPVAKAYLKYMLGCKEKIRISFQKVAAHTGVELNERADILAKKAAGFEV